MCNRPLIWPAYKAAVSRGQAKDIGAAQHGQGGERHCQWKKGARPLDDGAKRIDRLIHVASSSWEYVLTKRRPKDVCRRAQVARAVLQKRLKLRAIALSPITRIQTRKQVSDYAVHKASSLLSPALVNSCRGFSFARRTCRPSAVMR